MNLKSIADANSDVKVDPTTRIIFEDEHIIASFDDECRSTKPDECAFKDYLTMIRVDGMRDAAAVAME
jgi:hypothetical protein